MKTRPSIGLALSGGGARGLTHIGVLRVLEREGIPIDYLAGTSMGGVIAAAYAAGMDSYEIEQISIEASQTRHMIQLVDPGIGSGGIIRGQQILAFFKQHFSDKTFDDLDLPLALVTVDLNSHQEVILQSGEVALALRATTSIPGVFSPVLLDGYRLVDGGVLNNLPVDVVRDMGADIVIAVDIGLAQQGGFSYWVSTHRWIPSGISSTIEVLDETLYALRIMDLQEKLNRYPPDVLITPELPRSINAFSGYNRVQEMIAAGVGSLEKDIDKVFQLIQIAHQQVPCEKELLVQSHIVNTALYESDQRS